MKLSDVDYLDVLTVDGTAEDGTYQGDGEHAPFVIFNITQQTNLDGYYQTRQEAEQALEQINRNMQ